MARYKGIVRIQGKLDGKIYYRRNGKDIVQSPGGFDGARIKTEERYLPTRQLNSEFGLCSSAGALLKWELQSYLNSIPDSYVYNWIMKRLLAVKATDVSSERGARTVLKGLRTVAGYDLMRKFEFNRNCTVSRVLHQNPVFSAEKGSLTFSQKGSLLTFIKGADYAALQLVLLRVDFENFSSVMTLSDGVFIPKDYIMEEDLVLEVAVPGGEGFLMALLSIQFYSSKGEELMILHSKNNVLGVIGLEDL